MASFSSRTTSSSLTNASSSPSGRENLIASSFVKQYYTLLNKAPCFIHNFYSHDSTFIHGTVEMAKEHYTEPVVGREKIKERMEELKLNDCRAKIKQIDCLETLAGGLVIQVIGELSDNGRPMRRFLQTFVLAPSPDDTARQDAGSDSKKGVHVNENTPNPSHNQKFFVLNSIFRYQDDGQDSEYDEDDVAGVQANASTDSANDERTENTNEIDERKTAPSTQAPVTTASVKTDAVQNSGVVESEQRRVVESTATTKVISNGAPASEAKVEVSEKSTENGNKHVPPAPAPKQTVATPNTNVQPNSSSSMSQAKLTTTNVANPSSAPRPSVNEPKTWANITKIHPPSASTQSPAVKPVATDPQQQPQLQQQSQQSQQPQQQQQQQQQQQTPQTQPPQQQTQNQQSQQYRVRPRGKRSRLNTPRTNGHANQTRTRKLRENVTK